ncbi:CPBP family intramembrane metalloprotease [Streptomyces sp. NBC_01498]|uniref:CPBP family intramembrane glutamic endopeptidase n=1 Tax=Streptomyces sp. NBC_01498 TaxID=2975870 RepID=UPI002E7BD374|nr:CPBP family intramembrane glutamic endopeptidase [Streptomyces sp. NBC_01498]WTL23123.1 CPBP family intramembrane metalloprotease [Streptomyces sp. NBC_01498]
MSPRSEDTSKAARIRRWARSPWGRPVSMTAALAAFGALAGLVNGLADVTPVTGLAAGVAMAALAVGLYRLLAHRLENRDDPAELRLGDARSGLRRGTLIGLGAFTVTITVIALTGGYQLDGWGSFGGALTTLGLMCTVAVTEELIFRGVVFRVLEEKTGTWGALAASGLIFGLVHLANPLATLWGALAIAVEGGLLLASAYAATRSLWLPIGLHLGWNMAVGGIFGTTVSGSADGLGSLLEATVTGPALITGGSFGPEASAVAILVCLIPTSLFLRHAKRRGRVYARGSQVTTADR